MAGAGRKLVKVAAWVVGVVVVLLVALTLLLQSSAVTGRVKDLVVPRASAALGRDVTVQDAKLRLFPTPRVALTGAAVAGRPGEPPLVELQAFDVSLELWPLVASLGKDVRVKAISLVKPTINLVRAKDGTWNYEGLGKGGEPKEKPESAPPSQASVTVGHASIEDGAVRLVDELAGANANVAISKIRFDADHVGLGQPLDASISAALAGPEKNFQARIHASKLPASAAELGPGSYPELEGDLALDGLDLAQLRAFLPPKLTGMMRGGRVDAHARLSTQDAKYKVDGDGKLSQVRLRGQPAQGGFALHAEADPASGAAHAVVDHLALKGPGVDLGGQATVDAKPPRVRFAIVGPLLDLQEVMGLLPEEPKPKEEKPVALTAAQRKAVSGLDVAGTIDIDKVAKGALVATGVKARTSLEGGAFVLHEAHADLFGGKVDAAGTRVALGEAVPAWNLKAKLDAVDLEKALGALAGAAPVVGKVTGALDLDGAGVEWASLKKALTGHGALGLKEGALTTTDLGGEVLGAVAQGLRAAGKGGAAQKVAGASGKTELRDLAARFTVKDGAMTLAQPLSFTAPFGVVKLGGKIGLGGELGLQGGATLSKQALASVAGGAGLPLPNGLEVPLGLGGTLSHPAVQVNAQQAVAGLAESAFKQKGKEVQQNLQDKAKQEANKGFGDLLKSIGK
jgi:AsmA protein